MCTVHQISLDEHFRVFSEMKGAMEKDYAPGIAHLDYEAPESHPQIPGQTRSSGHVC